MGAQTKVAVGMVGTLLALSSLLVLPTVRADTVPHLATVESFSAMSDARARSVALFREVGKVIRSPRCLNCHPAGESPTQTELMRQHVPFVVRGDGGMGAAGLHCTTCHHADNFDPSGVPGNPQWSLAPADMAWQGRTLGQICAQIKDRARNGDRDAAALNEHMAHDGLVGWAWHPGSGRTPAPGTQAEFGALFAAWTASGAACPD